jgi:hypothetical protein
MTQADVDMHQRKVRSQKISEKCKEITAIVNRESDPESPFNASQEIRDMHEPIKTWLKFHKVLFINSRSDKPSTISKGFPDFLCFRKGLCCAVELKIKGGKLSKDQEAWKMLMDNDDTPHMVAYDVNDAIKFVKEKLEVVT